MKPKLVVGKTGVGKTHKIETYAKTNHFYIVEFNPSKSNIKEFLKNINVSQTKSITNKNFLYVFDDIDSIEKTHTKRILKFLELSEKYGVPVFLTTNHIENVSKHIKNVCTMETIVKKNPNDIYNILCNKFTDDCDSLKKASEKCNGDIRKAIQFVELPNTTIYNREDNNVLKAIKLILYEKDRKAVYNYIKYIPVSSLYCWLYETTVNANITENIRKLVEFDKMLYKLKEPYLYSFLAFNISPINKKVAERLQESIKPMPDEKRIMEKIRLWGNCSPKESKQYLHLLTYLKNDKLFIRCAGEKYHFEKKDFLYFGIDLIKLKEEKKVKKITTTSLLNF